MVPMRDGVRLAVDVYRPEAAGKFPALLALCVYGKDLQVLPVKQPQGRENSLVWDGTMESGSTQYFVSRGYVHVIADVRGCGDVGKLEHVLGREALAVVVADGPVAVRQELASVRVFQRPLRNDRTTHMLMHPVDSGVKPSAREPEVNGGRVEVRPGRSQGAARRHP